MNFKALSRIFLMLPSLLCALDSVAPAVMPVSIKDQHRMHAATSRERANKRQHDLEGIVKARRLWSRFSQEYATQKATIHAHDFYRDNEIAAFARNDLDAEERRKIGVRAAQEAARSRNRLRLQLLWKLAGKPAELEPSLGSTPTAVLLSQGVPREQLQAPRSAHQLTPRERVRLKDLEAAVKNAGLWDQFSEEFSVERKLVTYEQLIRPSEREALKDPHLRHGTLNRLYKRKWSEIENVKFWLLTMYAHKAPENAT